MTKKWQRNDRNKAEKNQKQQKMAENGRERSRFGSRREMRNRNKKKDNIIGNDLISQKSYVTKQSEIFLSNSFTDE